MLLQLSKLSNSIQAFLIQLSQVFHAFLPLIHDDVAISTGFEVLCLNEHQVSLFATSRCDPLMP